jgi:hypothetical protein
MGNSWKKIEIQINQNNKAEGIKENESSTSLIEPEDEKISSVVNNDEQNESEEIEKSYEDFYRNGKSIYDNDSADDSEQQEDSSVTCKDINNTHESEKADIQIPNFNEQILRMKVSEKNIDNFIQKLKDEDEIPITNWIELKHAEKINQNLSPNNLSAISNSELVKSSSNTETSSLNTYSETNDSLNDKKFEYVSVNAFKMSSSDALLNENIQSLSKEDDQQWRNNILQNLKQRNDKLNPTSNSSENSLTESDEVT